MENTHSCTLRSGNTLRSYTAPHRHTIHSISDVCTAPQNQCRCSICLQDFVNKSTNPLESTYKIPECGHTFHTNCLMQWFRREQRCPLCRDIGTTPTNSYEANRMIASTWSRSGGRPGLATYSFRKGRITIMKQICRRKDAPKQLKKLIVKHTKLQKEKDSLQNHLSKELKTKTKVNYKKHQQLIRSVRNNIWKKDSELRCLEGQLSCFKITEIIILKK